MKKEIRTIKIEIDPDSDYHESIGIGSLFDLIEERGYGQDTGIRILEIE